MSKAKASVFPHIPTELIKCKAIIYCRVSTKTQAGPDKLSLDSQEADCRAIAEHYNMTILDVVREEKSARDLCKQKLLHEAINTHIFKVKKDEHDRTSKRDKRNRASDKDEHNRISKKPRIKNDGDNNDHDNEENKNTVIIVAAYDRFSRDVRRAPELIYSLAEHNTYILACYNTWNHITQITSIIAAISSATEESDRISHRVKTGIKYRKESGKSNERVVATYGYDIENYIDEETAIPKKRLVLNESEQDVVRFIIVSREEVYSMDIINKALQYALPADQKDKPFEPYYNTDNKGKFIVDITATATSLSYTTIANMLNENSIYRRSAKWNGVSVRNVYKAFADNEKIRETIEFIEIECLAESFEAQHIVDDLENIDDPKDVDDPKDEDDREYKDNSEDNKDA